MNRTKLSLLAASVIVAVGCHDDHATGITEQDPVETRTYQAKAIDGYLRGATVWLDLNQDFQLNEGEPHATSGEGGVALLDVSDIAGDPEEYPLITRVIKHQTVDEDHGEVVRKSYLMTAPAGVKNITPLTHLIHSKQRAENLSLAEAQAVVAEMVNMPNVDALLQDYVEDEQIQLHAFARSFAVVLSDLEQAPTQQELTKANQALASVANAMNSFVEQQENAGIAVDYNAIELNSVASNEEVLTDTELLTELITLRDTDGDGISDGFDDDDDGDGVVDTEDALPLDASETQDSDGDGIGDKADQQPHDASNQNQIVLDLLTEELDTQIKGAQLLKQKAEEKQEAARQEKQILETEHQITLLKSENELSHLEQQLSDAASEEEKQQITQQIEAVKVSMSALNQEFNATVAPLNAKLEKAEKLISVADKTTDQVKEQHQAIQQQHNVELPPVVIDKPSKPDVSVPLTDFEKLQQRIVPDFVAQEEKRVGKSGSTIEARANEFVATQQEDGSWPGIDYASTSRSGWPAEIHLKKLRTVAAAYAKTGLAVYENATVKALEHWFAVKPSAHWWWEHIGKPKFLGPVALQLGDALPSNIKQEVIQILPQDIGSQPSFALTGANRTDIALGVLYRGLLSEDASMVGLALKDIENTIEITVEEGIQHDWSFQQHGTQLYTGGYGEVFLNPVLRWAYHVHDLQWKFEQHKVDMLAGLLLDGMRWMGRFGQLDYNVSGRGITRPKAELSELSGAVNTPKSLTNMDMVAMLSPDRAEEAMAYKAHVYDGGAAGIDGFKHFWRSDYSVKATEDFTFGIKMNSKRSKPTENGNGENLLGYWLGFGSTFLMQSGKEYYNIFPVWDWGKIPGVTSPEYIAAPAYWGEIMQSVSFVGGLSNGKVGITTMDMDMDVTHLERIESDWKLDRGKRTPLTEGGGNTKAKKAWFSFNDEIVALGAGISSTHSETVNTTLNQTLLNGEVTIGDGQQILSAGDHDVNSSNWVHHDGVGYVFLGSGERQLSNKAQQGSWSAIKRGTSDEIISKDVFTLSIPHGVKPQNASYEYIIAPGRTAEQTAQYQQNLPVRVVQNTNTIQAVEHSGLNMVSAVFYQAGTLEVSPQYTVTVDKPSVILLDNSGSDLVVTASTPGDAYSVVNLTVTRDGQTATQRMITPGTADQMGNSVQFIFSQGQDVTALNDETAVAIFNGATIVDQNTAQGAEKLKAGLTLAPQEDVFVQGGSSASSTYGGSGYMQLKNGSGVYDRRILLRFDLSEIGRNKVENAKLRLYVRGVKTEGVDRLIVARLVEGEAWSEANLTYNTYPQLSMLAQSSATVVSDTDKSTWIELDIADVINAATTPDNIVIELADLGANQGANFISFATKEYGDKGPQLVLQGVQGDASNTGDSGSSNTDSDSSSGSDSGSDNGDTAGGSTDTGNSGNDGAVDSTAKAEAEKALASQLQLTVMQDARVEGGENASTNFGSSGYMTVKNGPGKFDRRSVLRFDISQLAGATVTAAKLKVYANVADLKTLDSAGVQAVELQGFDWDENALNWNSLPDMTGASTSGTAVVTHTISKDATGVERWLELDVTDLVNANTGKQTLDLLLRNPNSSDQIAYFSFATKEAAGGANAAHLVMTNKASGFMDAATLATYDNALQNWQTHLVGSDALVSDPNAQAIIDKHVLAGKKAFESMAPKSEWNEAIWSDQPLAGARDGRKIKETFRRLKYMAIAYHMPGELKDNVELKQALNDALDVMLTKHFTIGMTHLGNWHEWEIGAPAFLNDILVLMREQLPASLMQQAIEVSRYMLPDPRYQYGSEGSRGRQFSNTGGNRADTVLINLIRGLLDYREDEVNLALASLPVVLKEVTRGDGFYRDGSFLQHIDIPYTGTYGGVLLSGVSKVLFALQGSDLLPTELLKISTLVNKAYEPLLFKGQMLDMMNGRAIARGWAQASGEGAGILRSLLRLYPAIEGAEKQRLGAMLKQHLQHNRMQSAYAIATDLVYLPIINEILADDALTPRGELEGNFLFYNMDRVVHRKGNYVFGIAGHSYRTGNYETGSRGENARGWYTGDGMTYLYDADLAQHYNHWPLMDMTRLAGTTSDTRVLTGSDGRRAAYKGGRKTALRWVGGTSNQEFGTFGMDFYNWDNSLKAKKSWFMFDDEIIAIGSDIQGERVNQTVTGIDGRKLNPQGNNVVTVDGVSLQDGVAPERTIHIEGNTEGSQLGIVLPYVQSVSVERSQQTGDWADPFIVNSNKMDDTQVTGWRLLSTIQHSVENNHYAYVLLPQSSAAQTQAYANDSDVTILHQNAQIHAVKESTLGLYAANVWVSEEVTTPEMVSRGKVSLLTREQNGKLHVWISQPTRDAGSVAVKFPQFSGATISSDEQNRVKWQDGFFVVSTEQLGGSTYHFVISQ
ncbi:polysaccharide lyase family 8 super-sandwich domain-containing protein [Vibrio sp. TRT 21S02]|uniref:polysaccharide lyase family 8 super-sandwich domain-containing protein n=1 Tax=Vibrio sp. TRT 21S02 TaxID=3418507 RepID=UPI003CECE1A9